MRAQPEVGGDVGTETSHTLGGNRRAHAGNDLFGHQRAPGTIAAFEDERPQSRLRKVRRGDQAVVAGADDDDVVCVAGHQAAFRARSERTT